MTAVPDPKIESIARAKENLRLREELRRAQEAGGSRDGLGALYAAFTAGDRESATEAVEEGSGGAEVPTEGIAGDSEETAEGLPSPGSLPFGKAIAPDGLPLPYRHVIDAVAEGVRHLRSKPETVFASLVRIAGSKHREAVGQYAADKWREVREREERKADTAATAGGMHAGNGWLVPRADGLPGYDTAWGEDGEIVTATDFTLTARGRTEDGDGSGTTWIVDIGREDGTELLDCELPAETLASTGAARKWFLARGCQLLAQDEKNARGLVGMRLTQHLVAQNPGRVAVAPHLGWVDGVEGFVTYEGVITADGTDADGTDADGVRVRPSRELRRNNLVNHFYGFDRTEEEVRQVLRELLTFHDETYTTLHASWMCASAAKGMLMRYSEIHPIFLADAPSESGKTKGYSELIGNLFGSLETSEGIGTRASVRNALTAHRGAPVRIDDPDDLESLKELLRQVTTEGTVAKMGEGFRSTEKSRLVAPLWISGEGFGFLDEKAMADRVLRVQVPSPVDRTSLREGREGRSQWDDVLEFKAAHRGGAGLTEYAGTLVHMVLRAARRLLGEDGRGLAELREGLRGGRNAQKLAVLRFGARILAEVAGDEGHVERTDAWCGTQTVVGVENVLTLKVIPTALQVLRQPPERPTEYTGSDGKEYHGVVSPLVYAPDDDGVWALWVHMQNLAQWWSRHRGGKVDERTETLRSLEEQGRRLGIVGGGAGRSGKDCIQRTVVREEMGIRVGDVGGSRRRVRMSRVPDAVLDSVLSRIGMELGGGTGPTDPVPDLSVNGVPDWSRLLGNQE